MIKLSIIIPYYNTYDLTCNLLKELAIQITNEVEVILIDDGCHETRLDNFDFIKITHLPEHKGASYAWNRGIEQAQGKFIGFIDSDDMIMMNYIETLIKAINDDLADEILFNWIDMSNNVLIKRPTNRGIWKAIYRKEICPFFDENVFEGTDWPFQERLKKTPHTKEYIDKTLYCYRSFREGSITWNRMFNHMGPRDLNNE